MPAKVPSPVILAFAAALLGMATFSAMDAAMKGLSIAIGAYNAMFWRVLAGSVIAGATFFLRRSPWPERSAFRLHMIRGSVASGMTILFFWGIARVPLAEGIALSFIAPLIALYLAAVLLKEDIGRAAILGSLLGLGGVGVIMVGKIGASFTNDAKWGVAAIFASAVLYAYNLILQRQQAQVASPVEIAFFQNIIVTAELGVFAPFLAHVPAVSAAPQIIGAALLSFVSLLLLSWAYARAEAQVLLTVEYTAFIWAAILGWLIFDEPLTAAVLAGTALIVAGCIVAARGKGGSTAHVEVAAL
jgi:S-adenosylmethionine uptake transporter